MVVTSGATADLATWAPKKFVGEKKPLEIPMVGNLEGGRNA